MSENDNENKYVELAESVETKLMTMSELLEMVKNSSDNELVDNVHRFKLMMVRKSFSNVMAIMNAQDMVQNEIMNKVQSDIDIYPLTTLLDIMESLNGLVDRNLKILESIVPKTSNLSDYLAANKNVNIIHTVNVDNQSPGRLDKIVQIVEAVVTKLNTIDDNGGSDD